MYTTTVDAELVSVLRGGGSVCVKNGIMKATTEQHVISMQIVIIVFL